MVGVDADALIQITERQLADAEEAYRLDPSDANQRRIMKAWSAVRRAREAQQDVTVRSLLHDRATSPNVAFGLIET
jgi:hypothetical protein